VRAREAAGDLAPTRESPDRESAPGFFVLGGQRARRHGVSREPAVKEMTVNEMFEMKLHPGTGREPKGIAQDALSHAFCGALARAIRAEGGG